VTRLDVVGFLEAEARFWRERAQAAQAALTRFAEELSSLSDMPPEPPVGTRFTDADGKVALRHDTDGWYCAKPSCANCPRDGWEGMWSWAPGQIAEWTRVLPGDREDGAA